MGGTPSEASTPSPGSPQPSRQGSFAEGGPHAAVESGEETTSPIIFSAAGAAKYGAKPGDMPEMRPRYAALCVFA